jgi:hypothetical protein
VELMLKAIEWILLWTWESDSVVVNGAEFMSEIDSESDENRDDVELEIKTNESDF